MSDGYTVSPDALRRTVEDIEYAVDDAARAAASMSAAVRDLARLVPGTRTAEQALVLAREWEADAATWRAAAEALEDLLEDTATDVGLADGELARLFDGTR
ncbi:hypothetical protein [Actinomycetospora corticicola]|uniref:Excreted virulence factor EspC (Type VII ESX diderm) n=1 Tax=Actinomycetospora corticicola TaxID=663602 RepID=A0A7Y9J7D1_9PSEU|nr:hypothetical protein [Actinomycetospora corticicola]NYD38377.1 hypothetical protein [Actinomycetospora corticicola]